jgi:tRNA-guanine transglycosylase
LVKIDYNGVTFRSHLDGSEHRFTPEKSIEVQKMLGADMMIAFDECAPYPVSHQYAQMAMKRTHRWGLRCLVATGEKQALFGVIQGSVYKDLREESAKFISNLVLRPSTSLGINSVEGFAGIAIGGVSVGESKAQMRQVLKWVMPLLPKEKPVHLLGVGEIDDIFAAIERGVDMMDCVMPTRLGRMGHVLINTNNTNDKWRMDITKSVFINDPQPIEPRCHCFVCQNFSRAYLCHLFRAKELLAYRLASYHNLYFLVRLFEKIREAIKKGEFLKLKKQYNIKYKQG